jgi:ATP-binding cassette subfamily G (WHITE) protein 1
VAIFILLAISGFLFGLMFGVLNKDSNQAINLFPLVVIPILIYGGLVVNIKDIPVYSQWLQYFSPLRHSFMIVFQDQLYSSKLALYQPYNLAAVYGLDGDSTVALVSLIGLIGIYLIFALLFLIIIKKRI